MSLKHPPLEIEIKLYINQQTMASLRVDSLLQEHVSLPWRQKELFNQYYDTPDRALTRTKSVLRIRKDGEQYIQTLKSNGNSVGGLSQRDELDWIITTPELDLTLLDTQDWPDSLASIDKKQLSAIFATDFIRHFSFINWSDGNKSAVIEIALDSGLVKAGAKQAIISELELELKSGDADTLLDFALVLAKRYPMLPSSSSKAAVGYRLAATKSYHFELPIKPDIANEYVLLQHHLLIAQQLLEAYQWQIDDALLRLWIEQLFLLNKQLELMQCAELVVQLREIIKDWQIALTKTELLADLYVKELANIRWGVFSLSVARWLLNNS